LQQTLINSHTYPTTRRCSTMSPLCAIALLCVICTSVDAALRDSGKTCGAGTRATIQNAPRVAIASNQSRVSAQSTHSITRNTSLDAPRMLTVVAGDEFAVDLSEYFTTTNNDNDGVVVSDSVRVGVAGWFLDGNTLRGSVQGTEGALRVLYKPFAVAGVAASIGGDDAGVYALQTPIFINVVAPAGGAALSGGDGNAATSAEEQCVRYCSMRAQKCDADAATGDACMAECMQWEVADIREPATMTTAASAAGVNLLSVGWTVACHRRFLYLVDDAAATGSNDLTVLPASFSSCDGVTPLIRRTCRPQPLSTPTPHILSIRGCHDASDGAFLLVCFCCCCCCCCCCRCCCFLLVCVSCKLCFVLSANARSCCRFMNMLLTLTRAAGSGDCPAECCIVVTITFQFIFLVKRALMLSLSIR
jgi:hypothetical protein